MPGNRVKAFLGNPIFQLLILRKHPLLGYYCLFQSSFQLVDRWQCLEGQLTRNMNPVSTAELQALHVFGTVGLWGLITRSSSSSRSPRKVLLH